MNRKELIEEFKKDLRHETALTSSDPCRVIQLKSIIEKLEKEKIEKPLTLVEGHWGQQFLRKVWGGLAGSEHE